MRIKPKEVRAMNKIEDQANEALLKSEELYNKLPKNIKNVFGELAKEASLRASVDIIAAENLNKAIKRSRKNE